MARFRSVMSQRERFEEKVCPEPMSGCHLWTAGVALTGYGLFRTDSGCHLAHRIAWQMYVGPIPDGMHVCHKCDTRACVNPQHMFLGTRDDNMADMAVKRRSAVGSRNKSAKLTESQVMLMRQRFAAGEPIRSLQRAFGVSYSTAHNVTCGNTWRHLPLVTGGSSG